MGNCMETCAQGHREEEEKKKHSAGDEEEVEVRKEGGIKVKILLTRRELEWLVLELKEKRERRLEDVFMKMGEQRRGRREGEVDEDLKWTPSLESIMESPEIQSFDEES